MNDNKIKLTITCLDSPEKKKCTDNQKHINCGLHMLDKYNLNTQR